MTEALKFFHHRGLVIEVYIKYMCSHVFLPLSIYQYRMLIFTAAFYWFSNGSNQNLHSSYPLTIKFIHSILCMILIKSHSVYVA